MLNDEVTETTSQGCLQKIRKEAGSIIHLPNPNPNPNPNPRVDPNPNLLGSASPLHMDPRCQLAERLSLRAYLDPKGAQQEAKSRVSSQSGSPAMIRDGADSCVAAECDRRCRCAVAGARWPQRAGASMHHGCV